MEIKRILWITHPAFPLSPFKGQTKYSKTEINEFIKKLISLGEMADKKEGTIVVLVKSVNWSKEIYTQQKETSSKKKIKAEIVKQGIPKKRTRQTEGLEKKLERELKRVFGKKLVVIGNDALYFPKQTQKIVTKQIQEKGFVLTPKTRIIGVGSYRSSCAYTYPHIFADTHKIKMRETKHTLPFKFKRIKR
jgi:hypothetical protein